MNVVFALGSVSLEAVFATFCAWFVAVVLLASGLGCLVGNHKRAGAALLALGLLFGLLPFFMD